MEKGQAGALEALLIPRPGKDATLPLHCFSTLPSTSDEARRLLFAGEQPPFGVFAKEQTAGRGRRGHSFFSPGGRGLYVTLALPTPTEEDIPLITVLAGTAALESVEALTGRRLMLKWVNDLFYNGKKAGGILAERCEKGILIGLGINLTGQDFPAEIREIATSLETETAPEALAAEFVRRCLACFETLPQKPFLSLYRERSLALGRPLTFTKNGETFSAIGEAVDDTGGLVVRLIGGERLTLNSGEISIRLEEQAGL